MILSYHPIIVTDENRICAGRLPDAGDLAALRRAEAVILPQGCHESLYRLACENCPHVFPNMDVRFDYPGKLGQIRLFRYLAIAHPRTVLFNSIGEYHEKSVSFNLPWVIKLNWGGQGEGVWSVKTPQDADCILTQLRLWEKTGPKGFLIQKQIDNHWRSLRVTVIGDRTISYWRILSPGQPFGTGIAHGAGIDYGGDPVLQKSARELTRRMCRQTRIQLAGFDFIFNRRDLDQGKEDPLILEINHFFGRTGLGGSQVFYRLLHEAVYAWLADIGLKRKPQGTT